MLALCLLLVPAGFLRAQTPADLRDEALATLKKAATYYRGTAASHGGSRSSAAMGESAHSSRARAASRSTA